MKKVTEFHFPSMVIASIVTEEALNLSLLPVKTQFELPHAETSNGQVVPLQHSPESKVDFGAEIYGIDLNNFTDADFDFISDALHKHKLLVFKEQPAMLTPQQQYKLTSRYMNSAQLLSLGTIMDLR